MIGCARGPKGEAVLIKELEGQNVIGKLASLQMVSQQRHNALYVTKVISLRPSKQAYMSDKVLFHEVQQCVYAVFSITVEHPRVLFKEERIFDTRISGPLPAL